MNKSVIYKIAGLPPSHVVDALFQSFQQESFDKMRDTVDSVLLEAFLAQLLLLALLPLITNCDLYTELSKANLAMKMAEAEILATLDRGEKGGAMLFEIQTRIAISFVIYQSMSQTKIRVWGDCGIIFNYIKHD